MRRRTFLQLSTAAPALLRGAAVLDTPKYHIVSAYKPSPHPGMPGPYPGKVVRVHSEKSIDETTEKVDAPTVQQMISRGMRTLTGAPSDVDAWRRFFVADDVVGIKVNCSGAPNIRSSPEVVAEIVRNLTAIGVKADQIWVYERFPSQMRSVNYESYLPAGVHVFGAEQSRGSIKSYDPNTYVEVDFFGEEDTRSNMIRLIPEKFTKIINVPNIKDHGAAGVTGCLKNIAYGSFSNVARSHRNEKTNTLTFIGTLASVEPLRSRTVLQIMDGLKGVWHGGPFAPKKKFRFFPKQMMFGTDPVAIDRLELDVVDNKRKAEGAISVWDRDHVEDVGRSYSDNPSVNRFVREPGHIEYAAGLGLGVYDIHKIKLTTIEL